RGFDKMALVASRRFDDDPLDHIRLQRLSERLRALGGIRETESRVQFADIDIERSLPTSIPTLILERLAVVMVETPPPC
ncbi:hypothetical protein, partial [endosymbiont of Ridgeia piscesae]